MFTGIIEELGNIRSIRTLPESARLTVQALTVLEGSRIGDSISVNGVCLTVTALGSDGFTADVMSETLRRSSLKDLKAHSPVNLERAMTLQSRLGGHFVSGHVDGIGTIRRLRQAGIAKIFEISVPLDIIKSIVPKGSVAIDGISLTVIDVFPESFTVSLIPHTLSQTTLSVKTAGSPVNIETDILGKYVARLLQDTPNTQDTLKPSALTPEFLSRHGYL